MRLSGAKEARTAAYAEEKKLSLKEAREIVETNDKARLAYGKAYYRANLTDGGIYDLVIDQTRFSEESTVELLKAAVQGRAAHG